MVVITEYFIEQTFPKMAGIILSDPVSFFFLCRFFYTAKVMSKIELCSNVTQLALLCR